MIKRTNEALLNELRLGSKDAREKLILNNQKFIYHILHKHFALSNYKEYLDDLFQIGMIGLIRGVDTYNLESSTNFSTYISICIKNELMYFFRTGSKKYIIFNKVTLTTGDDHESGDDDYGDHDYETHNIIMLEDESETIEERLLLKEEYEILHRSLTYLTPIEQRVIYLYFFKDLSQYQIGKIINHSQSYTSRIFRKSLKKLKLVIEELEEIEEDKQKNFEINPKF